MFRRICAAALSFVMFFSNLLGISVPFRPQSEDTVKNVILLIGDGMGFNSIEKTRVEQQISHLVFDDFTLRGESMTASANNAVTDSAAGGTALACGVRTNNKCVGVYPDDTSGKVSYPMNLSELAVSLDKSAGVITTDTTKGATPSAFSVHTSNRNNLDITAKQLQSDLTLLWGAGTGPLSAAYAAASGFTVIGSKSAMKSLPSGSRSYGQFSNKLWQRSGSGNTPTLTEMEKKAIDLLDDDKDGFFLMVEGAHIDKYSHDNNAAKMEEALLSFQDAVSYALRYARWHSDTLVVVTADHETGGITYTDGSYVYTTDGHSGANVPLLVYGLDSFMENGEVMKNTEVACRIAAAMGAEKFPVSVNRAA